jgi:leucyl aminopeptidase
MTTNAITNELLVLYLDNEDVIYNQVRQATCKKLSRAFLGQIKRKLSLEFDDDNGYRKHKKIDFNLENGSSIYLLLIKKSIPTLELYEALRDALSLPFKAGGTYSYNISNISIEDQERLTRGVYQLEELSKFQIPTKSKHTSKKAKVEINSGFYTDLADHELYALNKESTSLSKNVNQAKLFCYSPANILDARNYVKEIEKLISKQKDVEYEFFDYEWLKKNDYNLFLAVSQADLDQGGGIVKLTYRPLIKDSKSKKNRPLAIIGKGIVYDTGGLTIKPEMEGMHRDMTGSAVALGTFLSLVSMKVNKNLNCYLPITENKISQYAYRPSDIIVTKNKISVEVVDTDAEGRMCLADSIAMALEDKCSSIFDFATLTGTIPDSVGKKTAGIASNDKKIRSLIEDSSHISGENFWNFPLPNYIMDDLQSTDMADIKQSLTEEGCDHIVGAQFLHYFTGDTPWAHLDLSCEFLDGGLGLSNTEVTAHGLVFGYHLINKYIEMES